MAVLHALRVFTDEAGGHGNPLGVFLEGLAVPDSERQLVAAELGYSETVFVDDARNGHIQIFTLTTELGFAGHPTVGTAWLLAHVGIPVDTLRPPAGEVRVHRDDNVVWVTADSAWVQPPFELRQLASPDDVVNFDAIVPGTGHMCVWAWVDRARRVIRSRVFPSDVGVPE